MVRGAHASPLPFPASAGKPLFGEHSEPRCGNVPLTRTPNITRETPRDAYAPRSVRRVVNW